MNILYLEKEIHGLLIKEEQLWEQWSKSHWISLGDKNIAFFHSRASQRFRRNNIHGLRIKRVNSAVVIIMLLLYLWIISNPFFLYLTHLILILCFSLFLSLSQMSWMICSPWIHKREGGNSSKANGTPQISRPWWYDSHIFPALLGKHWRWCV